MLTYLFTYLLTYHFKQLDKLQKREQCRKEGEWSQVMLQAGLKLHDIQCLNTSMPNAYYINSYFILKSSLFVLDLFISYYILYINNFNCIFI